MITIRKSNERGSANHGWLKSFHTFSFADYYDPAHMNFGNLRVINEDYISPSAGFGKHPHHNMEIITYVISGALSHEDSMGNSSTILPGEVQIMSAGTGVFHSEFNHEKNRETHLLQIWILPKVKEVTPRYDQKSFIEDFKKNDFVLVVSGSGRDGSIQINQDVEIFVGKFSSQKTFDFEVKKDRKIWIQIVSGKIFVNGSGLEKGDAAAIKNESEIKIKAEENSEFLLFDL
ncbi:MAG: pirin family protein [Proteobacteria bacterium]|nr:pirin family protein [Pseudomonadota bacterium]